MLSELNEYRLALADFFNVPIIGGEFIYLNLYSFVHLFLGFGIMFFIFKNFKESKIKFLILFFVVAFIELFELTFVISGSNLFRNDPVIDTIWDLIMGMFGGWIYWKVNSPKN